MSKKNDMLTLWFEENVIPNIGRVGTQIPAEAFVDSFRDYFSVTLRDELPPHPISEKLERLRDEDKQ